MAIKNTIPPIPQRALQAVHADTERDIDVWRLALGDIEHDDPHWLALLSDAEQQQMRRYHFARDQLRFGATRATLRWLLAANMDTQASALVFEENPYGKPIVPGGPAFNVSHSGEYALIAIARAGDIGVDIEWCNPDIDALELARFFFTRAETDALRARRNDTRSAWFYRIWTAKEATLKAAGLGITEHLASFSVTGSHEQPRLRIEPAYADLFDTLRLCDLPAPPGYAAALAFSER